MRSNSGWKIVFHLAEPEMLERILYRFDDDPRWYDTGVDPVVDPSTGRRPHRYDHETARWAAGGGR